MKNIFKKILFVMFLLLIVSIILFTFLFKPTNVGKSIATLNIKQLNKTFYLKELANNNLKYLVFFSYKCPSCKTLLENNSIHDKITFVNIDFDSEIPPNVPQLIYDTSIEIFYVPYIVEIDSAMVIVREYKFAEIESKIKNGGRL